VRRGSVLACTLLVSFTIAAAPPARTEVPRKEHVGGTLRLLTHAAEGTLDPQINYTLKNWQLYQFLYDGLVAFRKAPGTEGFEIVPDLAEDIPAPSDGGRRYVFRLRKGIRFANGKEVTVDDVVHSFRRIFRISVPTAASFYGNIVGASECLKSPAECQLPGVTGDAATNTITFHLITPDADFLDKLAVPHATILPADTPERDLTTSAPPGTGPYMIAQFNPASRMTMVRNPYFKEWNHDAQPDGYPDVIQYSYGQAPAADVSAIERGEADWMFEPPPAGEVARLAAKYPKQVHINALAAIWYAPFNVTIAPFSNMQAREAVNYALDRNTLVRLFGGPALAAPSCQILPPSLPGYEPYCPYTRNPGERWSAPDVAKARALMEQSGEIGAAVTIVTDTTDVSLGIGAYLQDVLNRLGFRASVRALPPDIQFRYIENAKNHVQMSVTQWYQDYPAPADFLQTLFSCGAVEADTSPNISRFCDRKIEADMQKARATAVVDPQAAARMWAVIDREVTDAAPVAVLFTPNHVDFVSARVGNFIFSAQYHWIPSQSWVQ
jgi:peptide/nickel transport system substrate-binding protein